MWKVAIGIFKSCKRWMPPMYIYIECIIHKTCVDISLVYLVSCLFIISGFQHNLFEACLVALANFSLLKNIFSFFLPPSIALYILWLSVVKIIRLWASRGRKSKVLQFEDASYHHSICRRLLLAPLQYFCSGCDCLFEKIHSWHWVCCLSLFFNLFIFISIYISIHYLQTKKISSLYYLFRNWYLLNVWFMETDT